MIWRLFATLVISISVESALATRACEADLSTEAARFLRMIPAGLADGSITLENLRWMISQPRPASPFRGDRRVGNLSRKHTVDRAIPHINAKQWEIIVARAIEIEREHLQDQKKVDQARVKSKSIFSILPTDFEFQNGEAPIQYHITLRGEIFFCTRLRDHTLVYNFSRGTKFKIENQLADFNANDFFEMSDGRLLFTLLSNDRLSVHDARTGDPLVNLDLSDTLGLNQMMPLMYENNGLPVVVLGINNINVKEKLGLQPIYKLILRSGEKTPALQEFSPGGMFVRFPNGHAYAYGQSPDRIITIHDLKKKKKIWAQPSYSEVGLWASFYSHGPQLMFQNFGPASSSSNVYTLNSTGNGLIAVEFSGSKADLGNLVYPGGEATAIQVKAENSNHTLRILKLMKNESTSIPLTFAEGSEVSDESQAGFETPDGLMAMVWETNQGQRVRLHLYNVNKSKMITLTVPHDIKYVQGVFHNPADGRILMFGGETWDQWRIYQIFGPDGVKP